MITRFNVKYICNSQITNCMIDKIIKLKKQYWLYSEESHKKWMEDNIKDDEYHLCIETKDGRLIAYLCLVFLELKYSSNSEKVIGIGNVCVDKAFLGVGIGLMLMQICKYYIAFYNKKAMLLCKKELLKFYAKSNWKEFRGNVALRGESYNDIAMFNQLPNEQCIEIEREF